MKKTINILTLFAVILSLAFIPVSSIYASNRVNLTYYSGKGYFKAKTNRNKHKIVIKNMTNKKRGYAPAIRRNGYTFIGWYSKKSGGVKYTSSKIVTKRQKLYPHWIKKYKINTNYFVPMGLSLTGVDDFQKYYGKLTITSQSVKKRVYPGKFNCKNEKGDLIYISSWYGYDSDSYQIDYLNCKLKNVINIKKPTSMSTFFQKIRCKEI